MGRGWKVNSGRGGLGGSPNNLHGDGRDKRTFQSGDGTSNQAPSLCLLVASIGRSQGKKTLGAALACQGPN